MNRTLRLCLVLLCGAMMSLSTAARAVTLGDLQQRFAQKTTLRAQFEQLRTISGMSQPLKSSGNLLISPEDGLVWNQSAPFAMTMLMNDVKMEQRISGQAPQIVTAQSHPQLFQFNSLLTALFHADRKALEQNFSLSFSDLGGGRWRLVLHPTTTPINKLFRQITLSGAEFLNEIQIEDMQGDGTHVRFFNQKTKPDALTPDEKRYFSP
ncbi:outer membrane lipoprotein carrier protein LolA [Leminorella grimontii]|uniref:LolA family protein n=1 Tax=Leminorella grimontii TaxID=82981 RepID=UPI00321F8F1D